MPRTKPPYPLEFRLEAVRLVKEEKRKIVDVARDLGITSETLRTWIRRHEIDRGQRLRTTNAMERLIEKIRRR